MLKFLGETSSSMHPQGMSGILSSPPVDATVSICFFMLSARVLVSLSRYSRFVLTPPVRVSLRILSQGRRMKLAGTTRKKRWNLRRLWLRIPSGVAMRSINAAHAQSSPGTAGTRITRIAKKTLKVGAGDPRNQTSPR